MIDAQAGSNVINSQTAPAKSCLNECYNLSYYNGVKNITISGNEAWSPGAPGTTMPSYAINNNTIRVYDELRVTSGSTLKIVSNSSSDVRIELGPYGKIIVETGAKLLVVGDPNNKVKFTNACSGELWRGIWVLGNPSLTQSPSTNQGLINLKEAVVENSENGISTSDFYHWGDWGGIVVCANTDFLNNRKSVGFLPYNKTNTSTFLNCKFKTTSPLDSKDYYGSDGRPYVNSAQVDMWGVRNVRFINCDFANEYELANPGTYRPDQRGNGIYAVDCGLNLAYTHTNTFRGLTNGITIEHTVTGGYVTTIDNQQFDNNIHGILLKGVQYAKVTRCSLNVPESPNFGYAGTPLDLLKGYDKPVGIYTLSSYDFVIEENVFNNGGTQAPADFGGCDKCSYNIVINNSSPSDPLNAGEFLGQSASSVYRNQMNNSNIGVQFEEKNGDGSSGENFVGTEFKCNTLDQIELTEMNVTGKSYTPSCNYVGPPITTIATLKDQGANILNNTNSPAGNYFNNNVGSSNDQLALGLSSPFTYFAHTSNPIDFPVCNDPSVPSNCFMQRDPLTCPPVYSTSGTPACGVPCERTAMQDNFNFYLQSYQQYLSLVDGGNTTTMLNAINSGMNSGSLKNLLLSKSPYLSDAVIIAYLTRPNIPFGHIKEVMVSNSPLTLQVMDKLNDVSLPEGIINEIQSKQEGVSARKNLENTYQHYLFQGKLHRNELVRAYLEMDETDSACMARKCSIEDFFLNRLDIAAIYATRGEFLKFDSVIALINGNSRFPVSFKAQLLMLYSSLYRNGKSWTDLNTQEIASLEARLHVNLEMNIPLYNILRFKKKINFEPNPYPLNVAPLSQKLSNIKKQTGNETFEVNVYPNPANDKLLVEIMETNQGDNLIIFTNLMGEKVMSKNTRNKTEVMDVTELSAGVYIVNVINQSGTACKKVTITR